MKTLTLKILVVDPNDFMPDLYRRLLHGLTREGAEIENVDRPEQAMARLDAGEIPHLIITHGGLYCEIGIQFGRDLAARGYAGGLVLVSAAVGVVGVQIPEGLFDAVVPKPFNDPSDLLLAVRQAIKTPPR